MVETEIIRSETARVKPKGARLFRYIHPTVSNNYQLSLSLYSISSEMEY